MLNCRPLTAAADLQEMYSLREQAYSLAGKLPPKPYGSDLLPIDNSLKLLGFYRNDVLLGSVAVAIADPTQVFPFAFLPPHLQTQEHLRQLPDPAQTLEVGHLFLSPEVQGGTALFDVFKHIHQELIIQNRSHLLICADQRLAKLYAKVSFRPTGLGYAHPTLDGDSRLEILVAHQKSAPGLTTAAPSLLLQKILET